MCQSFAPQSTLFPPVQGAPSLQLEKSPPLTAVMVSRARHEGTIKLKAKGPFARTNLKESKGKALARRTGTTCKAHTQWTRAHRYSKSNMRMEIAEIDATGIGVKAEHITQRGLTVCVR